MSEWIDFSPEPIEFAERRPLPGVLLGLLGSIMAVGCLAVLLG